MPGFGPSQGSCAAAQQKLCVDGNSAAPVEPAMVFDPDPARRRDPVAAPQHGTSPRSAGINRDRFFALAEPECGFSGSGSAGRFAYSCVVCGVEVNPEIGIVEIVGIVRSMIVAGR
jgi:hypothetical protein